MAEQVAAPEALSVVLDGREVRAVPGEMVITTAERGGTFIPRFCYHPRMKPVGICRMCLVEIKGPRGFSLQPACFVPVADGMEVVTDSAKVRKAQDGVLEFLLINHPLDCPVCDKGGECPLQDQTLAYGPGESRFVEEKRHWEKPIAISPLVQLDRERCIQCARCTRFADEVAGDALIDFYDRGDRIEVATFPDRPFASYFSGNTVQICPVGALTATPYRFRARPWDLEQVESTCTSCAVGCRVVVQSSANRITRYLGVDSDPVNWSWMCDKGRFDFEAVNSDERITEPLVRRDGELVPASWGEALKAATTIIAGATAKGGPSPIGVLGGARLANEDAYAWAKLAKSVIGTDSVDAQLGDGLPAGTVLGLPRATIDQAVSAERLLLLGPDLREELPVLYLRFRHALVQDGSAVPKVVELAPLPTAMSDHAAVRLPYRPGEVAAAVRALVSGSAAGGDVAGVAPDQLEEARRLLSAPDGAGVVVVLGRPSLGEPAAGVAEAAAVLAEAWPEARFLPALRRGNVHGALDMGLAPGILPGRVGLEEGRSWFSGAWGRVPDSVGLDAAGMLQAAADGDLSILVLLGADPLTDFPDRKLAERALEGLDHLIAVDALLTEASRRADVVLPAAVYAERAGSTTNLEGRVSLLGQKLVGPGVVWPDWMIASELAARLGADLGFESLEGIWDEIERLAPSHAGVTAGVLASARDGVVAPMPATPVAVGRRRLDPMATPGIDAVERQGSPSRAGSSQPLGTEPPGTEPLRTEPPGDSDQSRAGSASPPPRPALLGPPAAVPGAVPVLDAYSLRLASGRSLYDRGAFVQASPSLSPLAPAPVLRVNPFELDRLGVGSGSRVRVNSTSSGAVLQVVADPGVPRGVAGLAFNLGDAGAAHLIDTAAAVTHVRLETVHD